MLQYEKLFYETIIRELPKISKSLKNIQIILENGKIKKDKDVWFKQLKFSFHHYIWKPIFSVLNHIKIIKFHTNTYKKKPIQLSIGFFVLKWKMMI